MAASADTVPAKGKPWAYRRRYRTRLTGPLAHRMFPLQDQGARTRQCPLAITIHFTIIGIMGMGTMGTDTMGTGIMGMGTLRPALAGPLPSGSG